jgi:hypothetical protein
MLGSWTILFITQHRTNTAAVHEKKAHLPMQTTLGWNEFCGLEGTGFQILD